MDCLAPQTFAVGDSVVILSAVAGWNVGQQLLVLGEDDSFLKLEGGGAIPKSDEFVAWRWVDDDIVEPSSGSYNLESHEQSEITPIVRKLSRAISHDETDLDSQQDDDNWRLVEDKLMKALLNHWGDGSFQPAELGPISARKNLENSLRGALAADLRGCQPSHKLTRQEKSALFSAWADELYSGVHAGKPMVSLGEATMCLRNFTVCF